MDNETYIKSAERYKKLGFTPLSEMDGIIVSLVVATKNNDGDYSISYDYPYFVDLENEKLINTRTQDYYLIGDPIIYSPESKLTYTILDDKPAFMAWFTDKYDKDELLKKYRERLSESKD